jgi:hypothetical protein
VGEVESRRNWGVRTQGRELNPAESGLKMWGIWLNSKSKFYKDVRPVVELCASFSSLFTCSYRSLCSLLIDKCLSFNTCKQAFSGYVTLSSAS